MAAATVAVVGATGVLGRHVVQRLIERGHDVRPVVRKDEQVRWFERLGVRAERGDILDGKSLERALRGCHSALHLATAIPRGGAARDWSVNDRIRREGTANLVAACQSTGTDRYVQQSIAMLVADGSGSMLDESAPVRPTVTMASAADMESIVARSSLDWVILRGGWFYGPGTGSDDEWRRLARTGELRMPGDGSGFVSLIHVADMADAVVRAHERGPSKTILSIVDDEPAPYASLYRHVAAIEGGPEPQTGGAPAFPSFRVSNARAHRLLDWSPRFASYRSGLV